MLCATDSPKSSPMDGGCHRRRFAPEGRPGLRGVGLCLELPEPRRGDGWPGHRGQARLNSNTKQHGREGLVRILETKKTFDKKS